MDSIPSSQCTASSMLLPYHHLLRDATLRSEREHLLDLEHQLVEARQRLQDLKEDTGLLGKLPKVCGCVCCPHSCTGEPDPKRSSMCTELSTRSIGETSRKVVGHQSRRQQAAKSVSSNAEGLLLAVDKFLSAAESPFAISSSDVSGS